MLFEVNAIESSWLLRLIVIKKRPSIMRFLTFYPSEMIRARTRFLVVSTFLRSGLKKSVIIKKFELFRDGITIYNNHLKADFGIVLRDPERFHRYAKFVLYSNMKIEEIKSKVDSLAELMKEENEAENEEPLRFIGLLKELVNEPTSINELFEEVDMEPKPIHKWFAKHYESFLAIVIPIVLFIITIIFHLY
jgi:hypothetical protein